MNSKQEKTFKLIGTACDLGGNAEGTALAPSYLKNNLNIASSSQWLNIINPDHSLQHQPKITQIADMCNRLAAQCMQLTLHQQPFISIGGDHSIAIGTWNGVHSALQKNNKELALIWIDAHLDAHTHNTSETQNIHGMPTACLMGLDKQLKEALQTDYPPLKAKNIFYIGIRSYEDQEKILIEKQGGHIYFMDDINKQGITHILNDIHHIIKDANIDQVGISIDLDALDPNVASAVTVPEKNGLNLNQLTEIIQSLYLQHSIIATELTEYAPNKDPNQQSLACIQHIITTLEQLTQEQSI